VARYLQAVLLLLAACPSGPSHPERPSTAPEPRQPQVAPTHVAPSVDLTPAIDVPVPRCSPCRLPIHPGEAARNISTDIGPTKSEVIVQADSPPRRQVLPIDDPPDAVDTWELGTDDINFDGYADLYLVTSRGSVNEYARYFRYVPEQHKFENIGTFPVFKIDKSSRTLSTLVKNGAGLDYESCEYTIVDGKPLLVRQDQQTASADPSIFLNIVRERVDGKLRIVEEKRYDPQPPNDRFLCAATTNCRFICVANKPKSAVFVVRTTAPSVGL
jgi:hypothetical protein